MDQNPIQTGRKGDVAGIEHSINQALFSLKNFVLLFDELSFEKLCQQSILK